jgi:hypothetical protein
LSTRSRASPERESAGSDTSRHFRARRRPRSASAAFRVAVTLRLMLHSSKPG